MKIHSVGGACQLLENQITHAHWKIRLIKFFCTHYTLSKLTSEEDLLHQFNLWIQKNLKDLHQYSLYMKQQENLQYKMSILYNSVTKDLLKGN